MLILDRCAVETVLEHRDEMLLDVVRDAYVCHSHGETTVPHSVFLRFPDSADRIIALPARIDGSGPDGHGPLAGVKWVSSFPDNIASGIERASAVILLSSPQDGRPVALLEGTRISARRTAASAAIAAAALISRRQDVDSSTVTVIGCGVINAEVLRFLRHTVPQLRTVTVLDADPRRAEQFAAKVRQDRPDWQVTTLPPTAIGEALSRSTLISFATTAGRPWTGLQECRPGTVVLHLSLRDIHPESLLAATNVVDDTDHVARADTSVDLAGRIAGSVDFARRQLGDLLRDPTTLPADAAGPIVFSPFGLGVLDVAVAGLVARLAEGEGIGLRLPHFLDPPSARLLADTATTSSKGS